MKKLIFALLALLLFPAAVHAQTPTPVHDLPIPSIPGIEDLKDDYDIPEAIEPDDTNQIAFFWDINQWLNIIKASLASIWFSVNRTYGMWIVVIVLVLLLAMFAFMVGNIMPGTKGSNGPYDDPAPSPRDIGLPTNRRGEYTFYNRWDDD